VLAAGTSVTLRVWPIAWKTAAGNRTWCWTNRAPMRRGRRAVLRSRTCCSGRSAGTDSLNQRPQAADFL